ncbi:MAG: WD40 repeat domain-containing protein, partial [Ilumatobacter sp.]|nr:WD40 repeat domain-containing protein [Ilumatobacter sp.]
GLLLAVEAFHRDGGGPVGVAALQRALTGLGSYLGTVGAGGRFAAVDWLGDDRLIAAGPDGTEVVSPDSGEVVARWDDSALVLRLDPADGALITHALVASADDVHAIVPSDDRTTVLVRPLSSGPSEPARRFDHDDDIDGIALSPGGTLLATIDEFDELRMYDVESGRRLWQKSAHPEETFGDLGAPGDVRPNLYYLDESGIDDFTTEKTHHRIVFSADGAELITQESLLRRWDAATGAQIGADVLLWRDRAHVDGLRIVSAPLVTYVGDRFGGDVVVHDQSGVTRVDLVTGEVLSTFAISEVADAYALAKIDTVRWRGGPTVWVLLTDGRILTVSVDDGAELAPPIDTQVSMASDLAISPSGRRAAVAGASGVGIFALDGSRVLARGLPRNDTQTGSITPDGRFVTQDYANGEEWFRAGQIYDVSGDFPESVSRPDDLLVQHSAGVGNAYKVVTREYGLRLLDLETREYLGPSLDISFTWSGQTATVDNRLLAAGTGSSGIVVYEVSTGREVATLDELGNSVASLSFNADGSRLAGASGRGDAMVWETDTWTVVDDDLGGAGRTVISLRYSPYDDLLVTVDAAGNLALRDATTHDVLRIMVGSGSPNIADGLFFFGNDRRYLVTAVDSAARLWDLESGVLIGDPFPNDRDNRVGGADGMPRFVTAVGGHRLIWELDVESWPALACRAAGRNLTREEWDVLGPNGGYSVTCDEWPPAPEGDAVVGSFERPDPPTLDPALEELGIQARDELIVLLESGDRSDAASLCDDWWSTLDQGVRALNDATVASRELRAVIDASRLCGGRSFDAALTNLIEIREGNVCGGYPSPCPQVR